MKDSNGIDIHTHSSHRAEKIALRVDAIRGIDAPVVLDAFSANCDMWNAVKQQTRRSIKLTRIEKEKGCKGNYLQGDNLKWMRGMDLNKYDVIDLDAYGSPYNQLEELKRQGYSGIVVVTWIVSILRPTSFPVLRGIGITDQMMHEASVLCSELSIEAALEYIRKLGAKRVKLVQATEKKQAFQRLYFSFHMAIL